MSNFRRWCLNFKFLNVKFWNVERLNVNFKCQISDVNVWAFLRALSLKILHSTMESFFLFWLLKLTIFDHFFVKFKSTPIDLYYFENINKVLSKIQNESLSISIRKLFLRNSICKIFCCKRNKDLLDQSTTKYKKGSTTFNCHSDCFYFMDAQ